MSEVLGIPTVACLSQTGDEIVSDSCTDCTMITLVPIPQLSWYNQVKKCCLQIISSSLLEPAHEIMILFVLRKLILQTRMLSHPVGLDVCLVGPFVFFHTSCVRTAKALARLRKCAGSPEPSLVAYVISTIIS